MESEVCSSTLQRSHLVRTAPCLIPAQVDVMHDPRSDLDHVETRMSEHRVEQRDLLFVCWRQLLGECAIVFETEERYPLSCIDDDAKWDSDLARPAAPPVAMSFVTQEVILQLPRMRSRLRGLTDSIMSHRIPPLSLSISLLSCQHIGRWGRPATGVKLRFQTRTLPDRRPTDGAQSPSASADGGDHHRVLPRAVRLWFIATLSLIERARQQGAIE